ncbi:MAG: hypothetical protein NTV36_03390, partial [Candidatus Staskawiczbacteria bacterium]|nr:hypothetical protein [Candidatus Staskawiczbacteria bacterium]
MATTKPFHESIVDVLSTCTPGQLGGLLPLIWQTKIPTNHDKIISAMEKAFAHYDSGPAGHDPSMKL